MSGSARIASIVAVAARTGPGGTGGGEPGRQRQVDHGADTDVGQNQVHERVGSGLVHRAGHPILEIAAGELLDRGPHLAPFAGLKLGLEVHQPRKTTGPSEHETALLGLLGLLRRRSRVSPSHRLAGQLAHPGRRPVHDPGEQRPLHRRAHLDVGGHLIDDLLGAVRLQVAGPHRGQRPRQQPGQRPGGLIAATGRTRREAQHRRQIGGHEVMLIPLAPRPAAGAEHG